VFSCIKIRKPEISEEKAREGDPKNPYNCWNKLPTGNYINGKVFYKLIEIRIC